MTAIVETKNLTRYYGEQLALNHLNLQIPVGAVYGFIGPNGAGKTTTMRILTTLLQPSGGEAWVAGLSVTQQRAEVRRVVGFMPDSFGFYNNMTAAEYLDFFAAAYHIPPARRRALIDDLLALVDLAHKRDSDVMSLSRGMKQRLSLARTLIHDPQLLILDEPASGLDPRARVELRELLRELRRLGKTIMISSHILTELAEMCTHIGIIERGTLLASGDVETIMRSLRPHRTFAIHVISDIATAAEIASTADHVLAVRTINDDGPPRIEVDIDGDDHAASALLARLVSNGTAIIHFAAQTSNLEEIFLSVTEGIVGS
ncbi:MAG: ABC transporter ATP-binding protein [Chloroflexi bacterium]|nr:MAG: ABC transporter ATP-binding protein [Chloroflexota bacterium]